MWLTQFPCHLFHDVIGDIADRGVAKTFDYEVPFILQFLSADTAVWDMRVEGADEDQEAQEEQRQDQLLQREKRNTSNLIGRCGRKNTVLKYIYIYMK